MKVLSQLYRHTESHVVPWYSAYWSIRLKQTNGACILLPECCSSKAAIKAFYTGQIEHTDGKMSKLNLAVSSRFYSEISSTWTNWVQFYLRVTTCRFHYRNTASFSPSVVVLTALNPPLLLCWKASPHRWPHAQLQAHNDTDKHRNHIYSNLQHPCCRGKWQGGEHILGTQKLQN